MPAAAEAEQRRAQRRVVRDDAVVEAVGDVERATPSVEREAAREFQLTRAGAVRADAAEHLRTHARG